MHGGCLFIMHELVEVYVWRVQDVESGWKVMYPQGIWVDGTMKRQKMMD